MRAVTAGWRKLSLRLQGRVEQARPGPFPTLLGPRLPSPPKSSQSLGLRLSSFRKAEQGC